MMCFLSELPIKCNLSGTFVYIWQVVKTQPLERERWLTLDSAITFAKDLGSVPSRATSSNSSLRGTTTVC